MACKSCQKDGTKDLKIIRNDFQANPVVAMGDRYVVKVPVKNTSWLIGDYGRVCLYDGLNVITESGSFYLSPGELVNIYLYGYMPNRSVHLKASLVEEKIGFVSYCKDAYDFTIKLGTETEDPENPDETNDDITMWLILAAVAAIIIFIVLKR